ncbi:MAG: four helix bundle protein [Anaerolineales bacterium]|nr:four helix bundle protein [Anaerolineales bacterium]MDP2777987.1 four helix bundle protein [Anaerolineales bacterium]
MSFKFEQLDVWQLSLDYSDLIYGLVEKLPDSERFNLKSQITRAATSVSLNIAEGSTGQSDSEQSRFLGMAIRSLIETVACQRLISRRKYVTDKAFMEQLDLKAQELAKRLHAFRKSLANPKKSIGEEQALYDANEN